MAPTSSSNVDRPARVIVVGCGRMGQIRASLVNANPRFELCGVVDSASDSASKLAKTYRVPAFEMLQDAISALSSDIPLDGIVVSSPTFTHAQVIREAAKNRLHVFVEKPVDETADKIRNLFTEAKAANIELCCGFQRRFDFSYKKAAESVRGGAVGRPVMASIFFADHPVPPKAFLLTGGNIFMDLAAHDIDFITNALDDKVVSVYASGSSSSEDLAKAGVHDNATVVMNFSKGAVVTLFMSRSASYGYDQRCEIFGSEGLVSIGNIHETSTVISSTLGIAHSRLQHSFPQRFHQAFGTELDAFADVLLLLPGRTPWPVTAEQCVNVQKVADAARKSAETGGVVMLVDDMDMDMNMEISLREGGTTTYYHCSKL